MSRLWLVAIAVACLGTIDPILSYPIRPATPQRWDTSDAVPSGEVAPGGSTTVA